MQNARVSSAPTITALEGSLFALLLLVDSFHFVFAGALVPYLAPSVSAFYVLGIGTVQVALYGFATRRIDFSILWRHFWFFLIVGFLVAASTALTFTAVASMDVGTASMLGKISTIFTILLGVVWLRDRLTLMQTVGAVVAIVGVFIISYEPGGDFFRLAAFMVVASTLMYALHAALVKQYGGGIEFVNFFFFRLLLTTAWLAVFGVARAEFAWPSTTAWLILIAAGTVDIVISRSLYYLVLRRLTVSMHAIVLTVSPVLTVVWSFVLFDTFPMPQQLIGGGTVLVGVLLATLYGRRSS
jgi:drug/metabolite transporter (DMT)-like permease